MTRIRENKMADEPTGAVGPLALVIYMLRGLTA
jgi:hypothetical protein